MYTHKHTSLVVVSFTGFFFSRGRLLFLAPAAPGAERLMKLAAAEPARSRPAPLRFPVEGVPAAARRAPALVEDVPASAPGAPPFAGRYLAAVGMIAHGVRRRGGVTPRLTKQKK